MQSASDVERRDSGGYSGESPSATTTRSRGRRADEGDCESVRGRVTSSRFQWICVLQRLPDRSSSGPLLKGCKTGVIGEVVRRASGGHKSPKRARASDISGSIMRSARHESGSVRTPFGRAKASGSGWTVRNVVQATKLCRWLPLPANACVLSFPTRCLRVRNGQQSRRGLSARS